MLRFVAKRAMEGCGEGLRGNEGWQGNSIRRRQGKSAASGRAQVVGWVEYSEHPRHEPCWRSKAFVQSNQCPKRRRPSFLRRAQA